MKLLLIAVLLCVSAYCQNPTNGPLLSKTEQKPVKIDKQKAWETAVLLCRGKPWTFTTQQVLEEQGYGKAEVLSGNNRWYILYFPAGDFTVFVDKNNDEKVRYVRKGKQEKLP